MKSKLYDNFDISLGLLAFVVVSLPHLLFYLVAPRPLAMLAYYVPWGNLIFWFWALIILVMCVVKKRSIGKLYWVWFSAPLAIILPGFLFGFIAVGFFLYPQ